MYAEAASASIGFTIVLRFTAISLPMKKLFLPAFGFFFSVVSPMAAQSKRLWTLRAPGEAVEYDVATFAEKQKVKIPAGAIASPQDFSINHAGQMLYAPSVSLPLAEGDAGGENKIWFWDGHSAAPLARNLLRSTATTGSNLAITESAATPALSADGLHLYWFSNQGRRLQRDGVDLSTKTTWSAWQTDLAGGNRQEIATNAMPDCSCPTGGCEETCPYVTVWVPDSGVEKYFLVTQLVTGKEQPIFKASFLYQENAGKWASTPVNPPVRRVLDAASADTFLEAVPDTGCCGWSNESDDQAILYLPGKTVTVFDELAAYKNSDYDVSFYTANARLSPDQASVAMTITATLPANKPIQLAAQGQANPEELQHIRKALQELPAVEVKSTNDRDEDAPRRIHFLAHASLVGWISEKEILLVEEHSLTIFNIATGARRKTGIHVEDAAHVFLR